MYGQNSYSFGRPQTTRFHKQAGKFSFGKWETLSCCHDNNRGNGLSHNNANGAYGCGVWTQHAQQIITAGGTMAR